MTAGSMNCVIKRVVAACPNKCTCEDDLTCKDKWYICDYGYVYTGETCAGEIG